MPEIAQSFPLMIIFSSQYTFKSRCNLILLDKHGFFFNFGLNNGEGLIFKGCFIK
jgi:hypothetical protein